MGPRGILFVVLVVVVVVVVVVDIVATAWCMSCIDVLCRR